MRRIYTAGAAVTAGCLAALVTAPAAIAADDGVDVVNTETVQVYVGSDGDIQSERVYEQLTLTGDGSVSLHNPIEEQGLRNLDGFSGYSVEDGVQNLDVDVHGSERLRSVSDYSGDLPLDVSIQYRLDGEPVDPSDIVGEDGELEVTYTVKNITAQPQEVTYTDGKGGTVTDTVDVPIPIVGSLTTVAPPNFTDVASDQANMAGDGKGGTKLSFTMTLFPPIGSDETTFGYTATITDGVVPPSSVTALPVNPLQSPSFKTAGDSYQSGSETGEELADGATEIDSNLLKLRDGASDLLGGLIQLRDGANQLDAGLSGEAAPGAQQLADGAVVLKDGLGQIDDGAGDLAAGAGKASAGGKKVAAGASDLDAGLGQIDGGAKELAGGAKRLAGGTGDALTGSKDLKNGLKQISDGLALLSSDDKLPAALDGAKQLKAGVDQIVTQVGAVDQPGTLLWGINQLATKLPAAETGSAQILGGLQQLRGDGSPANPGLVGAKGGVDTVQAGLATAVGGGGDLDTLIGGLNSLKAFCDPGDPTEAACVPTIDALIAGANNSKDKLSQANAGLLQVSAGLGNAIGALDSQLIPGATQLNAGLTEATNGAAQLDSNGPALRAGLLQVQGGLNSLVTGLTTAVAGVGDLSAGANKAYAGSGDLTDGLGKIDGGANELADGAGRLSAGTGEAKAGSGKLAAGAGDLSSGLGELSAGASKLAAGTGEASDGSQRLADGADELASGLGDAADGSGRLAAGLGEASQGAPKLVDGAQRLSDEGTSKLIDAGVDTAEDYGKLYATMEAGAQRADAEKMAYGAPEDAAGLTAYTYELLGDDGESGRNTKRGLGALVLLGLGGAAFALRRRGVV